MIHILVGAAAPSGHRSTLSVYYPPLFFMLETSGKYDVRNAILNVAEGGLWVAGATLFSAQTVLPALVLRLGGDNIIVGALGVIAWLGFFMPQVFASRYGQTLEWKKPWVVRFGLVQRGVVLLMAAMLLAFAQSSPRTALLLLLVLFTANQMTAGLTAPVWYDLYAKLTPLRWRGRLTGIRSSAAGGISLLSGIVLTWLLASYKFPHNYVLALALAFLLQVASVMLQSRLVEELPSKVMPKLSLAAFLRQLDSVMRGSEQFRRFLVAVIFLVLAATPMAFFTVYALSYFGASEGMVGEFTLTMVLGQIVGALFIGYLADRFGNRAALAWSAGLMLAANALALLSPSLGWFRVVFFCTGMNLGSEVMTRYNLVAEFSPVEQRSTYVGLMNTVVAPLYLFSIVLGWVSDAFGYGVVFGAGIFCSTAGVLLLLTRVQEPRMLLRARAPVGP